MFTRVKRAAAGVAALSLAVAALAGCSNDEEATVVEASDEEACKLFNDGFNLWEEAEDANNSEGEIDEAVALWSAAADVAETPALGESMRSASGSLKAMEISADGSDEFSEEEEEEAAGFMVVLVRIGEDCDAVGAPIEQLGTLFAGTGFEDFSADELEELFELYKKADE